MQPNPEALAEIASTIGDLYRFLDGEPQYHVSKAPKHGVIEATWAIPAGPLHIWAPHERAVFFLMCNYVATQIAATWGHGAVLDLTCSYSPETLYIDVVDAYQRDLDAHYKLLAERCRSVCIPLIRIVWKHLQIRDLALLVAQTVWKTRKDAAWDDDLEWVIGDTKRNKWYRDDLP